MPARKTWYRDVTTSTRFQPCAFASRAIARASPRVLYGLGSKHSTRNLFDPLAQSARAFFHFGSYPAPEITSTGATYRWTRLIAGSSRELRPPERTTTASA